MENNITIINNHYNFKYIHTQYEINQISPILELKRMDIINKIKNDITNTIKKYNIEFDVNNTFPRWLMNQMFNQIYVIDPLIPYSNYNNIQLINDIKYFNKNLNDNKIKEIIQILDIDNKCINAINELREFIHSKEYIDNIDNLDVIVEKNNFITIKWNTKKLPFDFTKNIQIEYKITEKIYNNLLSKNIYSNQDDNFFYKNILCIAIRYNTLNSLNQQLAVNPDFYNYLKLNFNVNFELFGSSFNNFFDNYCSLYYDLEHNFNSKGSFSNLEIIKGFYVANPPFDENIMLLMAKKLLTSLGKSEKNNQPLSILITIPSWTNFPALDLLINSKYLTINKLVPKNQAKFYDYYLDKIIYPCNINIILIQNKDGKTIHNYYNIIKAIEQFYPNKNTNKYKLESVKHFTRKIMKYYYNKKPVYGLIYKK